ncbi:Sorting nexin mvp1 [Sorochytrium milnesiophthora]
MQTSRSTTPLSSVSSLIVQGASAAVSPTENPWSATEVTAGGVPREVSDISSPQPLSASLHFSAAVPKVDDPWNSGRAGATSGSAIIDSGILPPSSLAASLAQMPGHAAPLETRPSLDYFYMSEESGLPEALRRPSFHEETLSVSNRSMQSDVNGHYHDAASREAASSRIVSADVLGAEFDAPDSMYAKDSVSVEFAREKAGFMIKHVNYLVYSETRKVTVRRRYSDFLWLHDYLFRKYPRRMVVPIPPKKLNADQQFLDRRRRGLARFLNFVISHPVLGKDPWLEHFLTQQMEFAAFRRTVEANYTEEAVADGEMRFSVVLDEALLVARETLHSAYQDTQQLCSHLESVYTRMQASSSDMLHFGAILQRAGSSNPHCFHGTCRRCESVCDGLVGLAGCFEKLSVGMSEQAFCAIEGVIEHLKLHRDVIAAFEDLFRRSDKVNQTLNRQIEHLERKVQQNQGKRDAVVSREAQHVKELERLVVLLEQDIHAIAECKRQKIIVHRYLGEELAHYHHYQTSVSTIYQRWLRETTRFAHSQAQAWQAAKNEADRMAVPS